MEAIARGKNEGLRVALYYTSVEFYCLLLKQLTTQ